MTETARRSGSKAQPRFMAMRWRIVFIMAAAAGIAGGMTACFGTRSTNNETASIDYNWNVRPVLSDNCFKCHGPDAGSRKAGLRLDDPVAAFAELAESPGKHAIVPGDPQRSELIRRITSTDPDVRMPPASAHKTLTPQQIDMLRTWVEEGAQYKPHWAFIPPKRPKLPATKLEARAANDVDRYILARLEQEGLEPAPPADAETLLDRLSLTLTGLPPTLEELDRFAADRSADAYEKAVDRLLASSAYGEQMASYWMDLSRWAETDGFLDDNHDRLLWPWRDWVIKAFNDNMPFNTFGTLQLAGDLMPERGRDALIATTFLRLGKRNAENGAIEEEARITYVVDRTDTVGSVFIGLTVGCARCHDHKYDPISQKDYYSLGGFFNSADEPGVYSPGYSAIQGGATLPWPDEQMQASIDTATRTLSERQATFDSAVQVASKSVAADANSLARKPRGDVAAALARTLDDAMTAWYPFDTTAPIPARDIPTLKHPQTEPPPQLVTLGKYRENDPPREKSAEELEFENSGPLNYLPKLMVYSPSRVAGSPPAVLQSPILKRGAVGQALFLDEINKGFLGRDVGWYDRTDEFSVSLWFYAAERYPHMVPIINHRDEDNAGGAGYRLQLEDGRVHLYMAHSRPSNMLALVSTQRLPLKQWTHIAFTYDGSSRAAGLKLYVNGRLAPVEIERDHLTRSMLPRGYGVNFDPFLGVAFGSRFREKSPVGSGLDEVKVFKRALAPLQVAYLHAGVDVLPKEQGGLAQALEPVLIANDETVMKARHALDAARAAENAVATSVPQLLVWADRPKVRPTHLLSRGVYDAPAEEVPVQALQQVFAWNSAYPRDRRGLARWLFDSRNPLTARVFVNRIWQMHFGRGLVETAEDFGAQSAIPTHPELLDYLAVELIESGWDIKKLHKLIVMSATYRQASHADPKAIERDPRNLLLARGVRQRMSAEMVRDSALAAAGLLVHEIGGPSVHPFQPDNVWDPLITFYKYPDAQQIPVEEHHRRSVYTFVKRNAPHPGMQNFDFPDRNVSVARRRTSNTPLQALELLNDPQFLEAYRVLATQALAAGPDADSQLTRVFRLARRESPSASQLAVLRSYFDVQLKRFAADRRAAKKLVSVGVVPADPALDPVRLAAMTNATALVMNTPDAYSIR